MEDNEEDRVSRTFPNLQKYLERKLNSAEVLYCLWVGACSTVE